MAKGKVTAADRRLDADLWIIAIVSVIVLATYMAFQSQILAVGKNDSINVLLRVGLGAAFQFGLAGLGVIIVCIMRKEPFTIHGLQAEGTVRSIAWSLLCFVPYIVSAVATGNVRSYLPFQSVLTTRDVLASGFPTNVVGILITAVAWGFFEAFTYVVIADKINTRFPTRNRWLNWGAIIGAVFCILIHGAVGVTAESVIEMIAITVIIYGMILVKTCTHNAWGPIFIFLFLWNAF